jgi:hypothetical protein
MLIGFFAVLAAVTAAACYATERVDRKIRAEMRAAEVPAE